MENKNERKQIQKKIDSLAAKMVEVLYFAGFSRKEALKQARGWKIRTEATIEIRLKGGKGET